MGEWDLGGDGSGGAPSGPAGGALAGTYPDPTLTLPLAATALAPLTTQGGSTLDDGSGDATCAGVVSSANIITLKTNGSDDTAQWNAAMTALALGGTLQWSGNLVTNQPAGFLWSNPLVLLSGLGGATLSAAAGCTEQCLNITIPVGGGGVARNFKVNGGFHAQPIYQSVPVENSVGTTFYNVQAINCPSPQFSYAGTNGETIANLNTGGVLTLSAAALGIVVPASLTGTLLASGGSHTFTATGVSGSTLTGVTIGGTTSDTVATPITTTGTFTTASKVIAVASGTGIVVGMTVTDTTTSGNILAGAVVTVVSGNNITISAFPVANGTGDTLVFSSPIVLTPNPAAGSWPGFQWANFQCEDCLYVQCQTPFSEANPLIIPRSFGIYLSGGGYRFVGGQMYGRHDILALQADYTSTVFGPITTEAPNNANSVLDLDGCWIYDGGIDNTACISASTFLPNIFAKGCHFGMNEKSTFLTGNGVTGNKFEFDSCNWVQNAATNTTISLTTIGTAGTVIVRGGAVQKDNATTINLMTVSSGSPIAIMPVACLGVTSTGTSRAVSTPGFPATTVAVSNTFTVPITAYVTNGTGTLAVAIDGTALYTVAASGTAAIRLDPGSSVVFTYGSGTPTWVWLAD